MYLTDVRGKWTFISIIEQLCSENSFKRLMTKKMNLSILKRKERFWMILKCNTTDNSQG